MTKRIIALLLALILTVGLLPTVALAATTDGGTTTDTKVSGADSAGNTDNPVHIVKSVTTDANGKGTLKLEAYVTDPMTIKTSDVPLDIVLVLDQSGSMGYCINCDTGWAMGDKDSDDKNSGKWRKIQNNGNPYGEEVPNCSGAYVSAGKASQLTPSNNEQYYAYWNGRMIPVYYCSYQHGRDNRRGPGWYYYQNHDWHNGDKQVSGNTDLYRQGTTTDHVHRLDMLKTVLTSFTDNVIDKANGTTTVHHRIALVGFSSKSSEYNNTELLTSTDAGFRLGAKGNWYDNSSNRTAYYPTTAINTNGVQLTGNSPTQTQYKQALVDVSVNGSAQAITNAINALTAHGGTNTSDGLEMAENIFEQNKLTGENTNRKRIVILFTDGDSNQSDDAKKTAKDLKDIEQYDATVYTVGLFKDADQSSNTGNNNFLQSVSSNNGHVPREGEKSYYLAATDAASLQEVFKQITEEVNKLMLNVGTSTVLSDTLSEYFDFDIPANGDLSGSVTFKLVPVGDDLNADGTHTWKENDATMLTDDAKPTLSRTAGSKSFTVTNFDYGANKITRKYNSNNEIIGYEGNKLVIEIPIKADTNCTSWDAEQNTYPTNSSTNDAKLAYCDEKNNLRSTGVASPEAPVARYSVTYDYGTGSEQPAGVNMPADTRAYIDGQTIDVKPTLTAPDGYTFDGWYTDEACTPTNKVDAANLPAINKANRTLYGKFTKSVFEVDLSSFVEKNLTLTGVSTLPTETFNVTGTEDGTTGSASFTGTVTMRAAGTQQFTCTKVSLSVGQHIFKVKENAGSTSGMNYDSNEHTLTVNVAAGGAVTADKVTITNTYAPEAATLDLAGKFKKVLTSNTLALPTGANSFELTIKNGSTTVATGTAKVTLGNTPNADGKFTGEANFVFTPDNLTFASAGTYTYKVTETNSDIAGMKYASEADLTIVVENDSSTGKLKVTSAMINGVDIAAETGTNTATINNTFTAAELPLDPTPGPSGTFTRVPIAKAMTGEDTKEKLTFTAEIYHGTDFVTSGTAEVGPAAKSANFSDFGALTFNTTGDHTFTIKEAAITPAVPGMTYDVNKVGEGHTMVVTIDEDKTENTLYVERVTIDGTVVYTYGETEATQTWLTITNNYVEPKETFDLNTLITKEFKKDPTREGKDIPTGTYEFKAQIVETDSTWKKLENGATYVGTATLTAGGTTSFVFGDGDAHLLKLAAGPHYYLVNEIGDTVTGTTATINYDNRVYGLTIVVKNDGTVDADGVKVTPLVVEYSTAEDAVEFEGDNHITFTNTYFEKKDPSKLYLDFSKYVQKELTATGTKTASDVNFTVNVDGNKIEINSLSGEEISTYDEPAPDFTTTLGANFDSITGGETKTAPFNGSTVEIDHAGQYYFVLTEEKGTRTGVTYDDSTYILSFIVNEGNGKLVVSSYSITKDGSPVSDTIITFHNTIDTGKDDYYPIIIPTIINKDTGMLNKTDHFAYVIGYPDGTVHPNGQITRAEVATIFFRLLRDEVRDGAFTTSNSYSDVAYGKWYNNPISTMSALGIITGYPDGTFKPNKPITRAEFAAIAARFDETQSGKSATFSDVIGHWAAKEIGIAYYNDWIKGYPDGTFKPDQNITRAEAMTLINRVLERKPESPADLLTNMNKWTDNMDTSKWYYLDVQEATNSHGYTRKTFNYELWRQMLPDPDWSRYER